MEQIPLFEQRIWSVSHLTRYVRELLERDDLLQDVWVQGEISNLSKPSSGHIYFTLKDVDASLRCVMWRSVVVRQAYLPKEGDAIEVHGYVSVYDAGGQYQLYADVIRPLGEGALHQEFLRLMSRLAAEGLFDPERKRSIPQWPERIGLVTSPTGAALQDVLSTLSRRYPLVEIYLFPTAVQGDDAPPGIVTGIEMLNRWIEPDMILLVRGGGSLEDLWAFNDERVVRAVAASQAPVISGVGHETDFTITDFSADLRAATPTAAAELATPDRMDLQKGVSDSLQYLSRIVRNNITASRLQLSEMMYRLNVFSPIARVRTYRQLLDENSHRMDVALLNTLMLQKTRLEGFKLRLENLNPMAVLGRGYAIVTKLVDGRVIRSIKHVTADDVIDIKVSDGRFGAHVLEDE